MNIGSTLALTFVISLMLFTIQRAESRRKLVVSFFVLIFLELTRRYAWYRDLRTEWIVALIAAIILNFLFWILIGRYNPPGSSDDIQVLGLDD